MTDTLPTDTPGLTPERRKILLEIARRGTISFVKLAAATGLAPAVIEASMIQMSRYADFDEDNQPVIRGMGLVRVSLEGWLRRRISASLTEKGKEAVKAIDN